MTSAITHTLFHFLWEGSLIAILLAFALYACRPASSRVRYALACMALLAMLTAFFATLAWFWPHSQPVATRSATAPRTFAAPPVILIEKPPTASTPAHRKVNWVAPLWIESGWALGVLLFSLRSFAAWLAAMRLRRTGVAAASALWQARFAPLLDRARVSPPVILLESCLTDVPVVIGFFKPVILVPASLFTGFPPQQLEFILLHELAHIRRHDYLVNLLQSLAEDLLFYHPAVWWVSTVIRAEREHCCDDAVVAAQGDARGFAEALAALEQQRWSAYEAALAANGGHLMSRIQRLLNKQPKRPRFVAAPAFWASLLAAAGLLLSNGLVPITRAQPAPAPQAPAATTPAPVPAPAPAAAPARVPPPAPQTETIAQPMTAEQKKEAEEKLKRELETPYQKWLNEDVLWIITAEERKEFQSLSADEQRERFIEQFWLRRDPTPATPRNEYREEYYRRIAYANDNFSSGVPGWKTDRGMIYIKYGPPDEREEHASGGTPETYAYEKWRYRYLAGIGDNVELEFVDESGKGEFHLTADPGVKDKLLYVPAEGLALAQQLGARPLPANLDQFTRITQFAQLQAPPRPVVPAEDAIEAIVFRGARRTPQDLLLNLIPTRMGDKLDQDALDKDTIALWNTQRFTDIKVGYARGKTGWIVTFTVTERPVQRAADAQTVPLSYILDVFKDAARQIAPPPATK